MFKIFEKKLLKIFNGVEKGSVIIEDNGRIYNFGNTHDKSGAIKIRINNKRIYPRVFLNGTLGAGEGYVYGDWECDDLYSLFNILFINSKLFSDMDAGFFKIMNLFRSLVQFFKINNIVRAKQNILQHYDLGNDFFRLFLDKQLMYSCAYFPDESADLETASVYKLKMICEKLKIKPGDHILEIGTGWGGFAFYAVENYGCHVTTTTISEAQYEYVKNQIKLRNLESKVQLLNKDYRLLEGLYDKVVSIEMIEAVGHQYYGQYFSKINSLLKTGGLFLLQAITINDADYERFKHEVDFMKKYIFPGGALPSLHIINKTLKENTSLQVIDQMDLSNHYVRTLKEWEKRFIQNKNAIAAMGFDNSFVRRWIYYFNYCASGFSCKNIFDVQILSEKGQ